MNKIQISLEEYSKEKEIRKENFINQSQEARKVNKARKGLKFDFGDDDIDFDNLTIPLYFPIATTKPVDRIMVILINSTSFEPDSIIFAKHVDDMYYTLDHKLIKENKYQMWGYYKL